MLRNVESLIKIIPEDALWITKEVLFFKNNKEYNLGSYASIEENKYGVGIVNGYAYFDELWDKARPL